MFRREVIQFFRRQWFLALSGALILALGIGATTLALTFLQTFESLAYPGVRPGRMATVGEENVGAEFTRISFERFERLRRSSAGNVAWAASTKVLPSRPGVPNIAAVSRGFFSNFTIALSAGRDFHEAEEARSAYPVTIVSARWATRMFGTPVHAVGQRILLKGISYEIVGVAPPKFEGMFGETTDLWVPASAFLPLAFDGPVGSQAGEAWKGINFFYAFVVSQAGSGGELTSQLSRSLPKPSGDEARLQVAAGLTDDPARDRRMQSRLRTGFVVAVAFAVATALNLAWLLLARAPTRSEEMRLRTALGADTRTLLIECAIGPAAIVALGFAGAGLVVAAGLILIGNLTGLEGQAARGAWRTAWFAYSWQLPFTGMMAVAVAALPSLSVFRDRVSDWRAQRAFSGPLSAALVVPVMLQVSLAATVCILAAMMIAALLAQIAEPLGYEPSSLIVLEVGAPSGRITVSWSGSDVSETMRGVADLLDRARAIPGVRAAAYCSEPMGEAAGLPIWIEGKGDARSARLPVQQVTVSPGYFNAVGARVLEGQDFAPGRGTDEVLVNRAAAAALQPNGGLIGQVLRITIPAAFGLSEKAYDAIVIGVVDDMKPPGFGRQVRPAIYQSFHRVGFTDLTPRLILNGTLSQSAIDATLGKEVPARLPGMAVLSAYRVSDRLRIFFAKEAKGVYLGVGGALVMATLSAIGLYASLAHFVRSRRRELAIRACLGASLNSMRIILYRRAIWIAGIGAVLSTPLWPLLAHLPSLDVFGAVLWSTPRAVAIAVGCVVLAVVVARLAAREGAFVSPAQMLQQD